VIPWKRRPSTQPASARSRWGTLDAAYRAEHVDHVYALTAHKR